MALMDTGTMTIELARRDVVPGELVTATARLELAKPRRCVRFETRLTARMTSTSGFITSFHDVYERKRTHAVPARMQSWTQAFEFRLPDDAASLDRDWKRKLCALARRGGLDEDSLLWQVTAKFVTDDDSLLRNEFLALPGLDNRYARLQERAAKRV